MHDSGDRSAGGSSLRRRAQPKNATLVPKPQGGWDTADAPATATKRKAASEQQLLSAPLSLGSFTLGKR